MSLGHIGTPFFRGNQYQPVMLESFLMAPEGEPFSVHVFFSIFFSISFIYHLQPGKLRICEAIAHLLP